MREARSKCLGRRGLPPLVFAAWAYRAAPAERGGNNQALWHGRRRMSRCFLGPVLSSIFSPPQHKLEVSDEMSTGSAALRAASVPAPGGDGGAAGEPRRPLGGLELPLRLRGETRGP